MDISVSVPSFLTKRHIHGHGFDMSIYLISSFFPSQNVKNYTTQPVPGSLPALTHPTAGAFVDLNSNMVAGINYIILYKFEILLRISFRHY